MFIHLRPQKYDPGPWHIELVIFGSLLVLSIYLNLTTFTTSVIIYTVPRYRREVMNFNASIVSGGAVVFGEE